MTISKLITKTRDKLEITQTALAQKLGISQTYMSQIERGACPLAPGLATPLAEALGLPPKKLHRMGARAAGWEI